VIRRGSASSPRLRIQKRFDHVGVRPLLHALVRRAYLKLAGLAPGA
jgi:hypothetical protein